MNRKLQLLILLSNFVFTSCAQNTDNKEKIKTEPLQQVKSTSTNDYSLIKLIDKFDNTLVKDATSEKTEAQFSPVYIGEKKDEIKLTYKTGKIENRVEEWDTHKRPNSKTMTITIDTSRTIGSPMRIWEYFL